MKLEKVAPNRKRWKLIVDGYNLESDDDNDDASLFNLNRKEAILQ